MRPLPVLSLTCLVLCLAAPIACSDSGKENGGDGDAGGAGDGDGDEGATGGGPSGSGASGSGASGSGASGTGASGSGAGSGDGGSPQGGMGGMGGMGGDLGDPDDPDDPDDPEPEPEPEIGDITVRVYGGWIPPEGGFLVQYAAPDGEILDVGGTDEAGLVVFEDVVEGGTVTAITLINDSVVNIRSKGNVHVNTEISFGDRRDEVGTFELTYLNVPAGDRYAESIGSATGRSGGPSNGPWSGTLSDTAFLDGPTAQVFGWVLDENNEFLAVAALADVQPTGTRPTLSLEASLATWETSFGTVVGDFRNSSTTNYDADGYLYGYRGQHRLGTIGTSAYPLGEGESMQASLGVVRGFHDFALAGIEYYEADPSYGGTISRSVAVIPADGATTVVTVDLADAYPHVESPALDEETLTFTSQLPVGDSCGGVAPDTLDFSLSASGTLDEKSKRIHWRFSAPYAESVALPQLAPELAAQVWPADASVDSFGVEVIGFADWDHRDYIALNSRNGYSYVLPGDRCESWYYPSSAD